MRNLTNFGKMLQTFVFSLFFMEIQGVVVNVANLNCPLLSAFGCQDTSTTCSQCFGAPTTLLNTVDPGCNLAASAPASCQTGMARFTLIMQIFRLYKYKIRLYEYMWGLLLATIHDNWWAYYNSGSGADSSARSRACSRARPISGRISSHFDTCTAARIVSGL